MSTPEIAMTTIAGDGMTTVEGIALTEGARLKIGILAEIGKPDPELEDKMLDKSLLDLGTARIEELKILEKNMQALTILRIHRQKTSNV